MKMKMKIYKVSWRVKQTWFRICKIKFGLIFINSIDCLLSEVRGVLSQDKVKTFQYLIVDHLTVGTISKKFCTKATQVE